MPERIVVTTREELHEQIDRHIREYGEQCDLNHIDVSQVTDMRGTFAGSKFKGDISKWDVSNVTAMGYMFESSQFNGDISNWNVSNVNDMRVMFENAAFNGDLSRWKPASLIGRPFDRWHPSPLGTYSALWPHFKDSNSIPQRERFEELRLIAEGLGMPPLQTGYYIYDLLYGTPPTLIMSPYEFT